MFKTQQDGNGPFLYLCETFRLMVLVFVLIFILVSCLTNYNLKHLHCLKSFMFRSVFYIFIRAA